MNKLSPIVFIGGFSRLRGWPEFAVLLGGKKGRIQNEIITPFEA